MVTPETKPDPLVQVKGLTVHIPIRQGLFRKEAAAVRVVTGLTFDIARGETLSLVGEKGSGKSTIARAILRLIRPTSGRVIFQGRDLTRLGAAELRRQRRHMQLVLEDPYASLNPRLTIGQIIAEPLAIHGELRAGGRDERAAELLARVNLNPYLINRRPHELSGGQRQRVAIARALATGPSFLIADDPVSALDPAVQGGIIHLLAGLKSQLGLTYLLLAANLVTVREVSDWVGILYAGRLVELSTRDEIFARPLHPHTQALLSAIPAVEALGNGDRRPLPMDGQAPDPANLPPGCPFHPRCPYATDLCRRQEPVWRDLGRPGQPHWVACHHAESFL